MIRVLAFLFSYEDAPKPKTLFLCGWRFFTGLEVCLQHHSDDRPQKQTPEADAFIAEVHGKQRQQWMQTNLCTKDFWLHDLPHDLHGGVNDHIANGKLGRAKNQMDDGSRPENETAAKERQGINDGDDDAEQQCEWRTQHHKADECDGKGVNHQNQLCFDIAPYGCFQIPLCIMDGCAEQRKDIFFIKAANEGCVFCEEIGGQQRNEHTQQKIRYGSQGRRTCALYQRKQYGGQIAPQLFGGILNEILQRVRQYHQQAVQLCPKTIQCILNQKHVLRHKPQERLCLCGDTVANEGNKKRNEPQKQ